MSHPWDQLPNESANAYHSFRMYLEDGPARSHTAAWLKTKDSAGQARVGRASGQFRAIAKRYNWIERARAWDAWTASREIEAQAKAAEKIAIDRVKRREMVDEEAWEIGQELKAKGRELLQYVAADTRTPFRDAAALIKLGNELTRLSLGLPTGATAVVASVNATTTEPGSNVIAARLAAKFREVAASEALELMGKEDAQPEGSK